MVERVEKFKLLGVWLHEELRNHEHLNSRKDKSTKSSFQLNKVGFSNYKMKFNTKAHLYKAYCRSTLTYGLENVYLNKQDLNELAKYEAKILKASLRVSKRSSTTRVMRILGIESIEKTLIQRKLGFFIQLMNNVVTSNLIGILINLNKLHECSLIREICDQYLNVNTNQITSIKEIRKLTVLKYNEMIKYKNLGRENSAEDRAVVYLLGNRSKLNNNLINNYLQYNIFDKQ